MKPHPSFHCNLIKLEDKTANSLRTPTTDSDVILKLSEPEPDVDLTIDYQDRKELRRNKAEVVNSTRAKVP
jgi:hypothetical protein